MRLACRDHRAFLEPTLDELAGSLTRREHDVVALLARGLSNRQIAAELVISVATARVHVDHILAKLGVHSRLQVAAWAVRRQLDNDSPTIVH